MLLREDFWAGAVFFGLPLREFLGGETRDGLLCFCTGAEIVRARFWVVVFLVVACRVCRTGATATCCCLVLLPGIPGRDCRLGALACDADRCLV